MKRRYVKFALACGTAFSALAWSAMPANAQAIQPTQDPANPSTSAEPPSPEAGIGDIIVTARKRSEVQRDVPVSIESLSGAQLSASKITQIVDLVSRVPTLTVSYGSSSPFAEIRGFGTGNSESFDQAVGKFVDNVSYGRGQDLRLPLFDVERVEVLKGPQVLLYGNSSTAGALNITTKKPGNTFAADGSVAYEFNENEVITQGGITIPVSDHASLRVSGIYQNLARGSTYNMLTGDRDPRLDNYAARAILRLTPAHNLEIMLKAEYDHLLSKGSGIEAIAQPSAGPSIYTEVNPNNVTAYNNNVAPFFQKNYNELHSELYQADVNLTALGGTITSTTAYRKQRYAGSVPGIFPVPVFNAYIAYDYNQFSQELRYGGKFGKLDLTFGGFYQHESYLNASALDTNLAALGAPFPPFAFNFFLREKTNSYSGFGDLTYHLTDRLSLEIGGRYSRITRGADQSAFPGNVVPAKSYGMLQSAQARNLALYPLFTGFFGVAPHDFTGLKLAENHFQPQIVGQYKIFDKAQVYAKYVKGDKAGAFDANYQGLPGNVSPANVAFAPEKAESFEIGFKGLILDNKLNFAIAAFRTTFTNLQTNAFIGTATVAVVTNVGKARTQGVEAELHYAPVAGLRIDVTGAYTDAKYLDFPGGACTYAQGAAPGGCTQQDLSGTPTPFSSKFAGTIGLDYSRPIGDYVVDGGVLVIARSKYNPSTNNEPLLEQRGYAQIDAHIDLKPAGGKWSVSLFGRNLTDYHYRETGGTVPLSTGLFTDQSRGRQLGVRAGFDF